MTLSWASTKVGTAQGGKQHSTLKLARQHNPAYASTVTKTDSCGIAATQRQTAAQLLLQTVSQVGRPHRDAKHTPTYLGKLVSHKKGPSCWQERIT